MTEPGLKRLCRSLGPVLNEPYESDGDSSACLSGGAADSDESTDDELTNYEIEMDSSPRSDHGQPEDYEMISEVATSDDEAAMSWWAAGPDGPLKFLMRLEYDLLNKLQGYCLTSGEELPNGNGWVINEGELSELAHDLEYS